MGIDTTFPYIPDESFRKELMRRFNLIGIRIPEATAFRENNYTVSSGTIEFTDGQMLDWTVSENVTANFDSFQNGDGVTIVIPGTSFTVSWPGTMKWIGGSEPDLDDTNDNVIVVWKQNNTVYGKFIGAAS